ncbi:MAG: acylphosphatase [Bacteroidota bacterium]|nr:acylphosphatase [Bacteroidota bacterium]
MYKVSLIIRVKEGNSEFNFFAMQTANNLNLDGFVKLINDGIYLIEVEGKEDQINNFVECCNTNPEGGDITEYKLKTNQKKKFSAFLTL